MSKILESTPSCITDPLEYLVRYLPRRVLQRLLRESVPAQECGGKGRTEAADVFHGAAVFFDVTGWTKLTEHYAQRPDGAEQISNHLNSYFSNILAVADRYGGDVASFSGDALLFVWAVDDVEEGGNDEGKAEITNIDLCMSRCVERALRCAAALLRCHHLHATSSPALLPTAAAAVTPSSPSSAMTLSSHIGLGAGELRMIFVGLNDQMRWVTVGPAVEQASTACSLAKQGELVLSPQAYELVSTLVSAVHTLEPLKLVAHSPTSTSSSSTGGIPAVSSSVSLSVPSADAGGGGEETMTKFFRFTGFRDNARGPASPAEPQYVSSIPDISHHLAKVKSFLFDLIWRSPRDCEGQLRTVTTVFIRLAGSYDQIVQSGWETLSKALQMVFELLHRHDGVCNKIVHDDKGLVVLCVFGLPFHCRSDDTPRAVNFAMQCAEALERIIGIVQMGLTSARVYCGNVGGPTRREYSVLGEGVNLAARLMSYSSTKNFNVESQLLCDEATRRGCESGSLPAGSQLGAPLFGPATSVTLKGLSKPTVMYSIKKPVRGNAMSSRSSSRSRASSVSSSASANRARRRSTGNSSPPAAQRRSVVASCSPTSSHKREVVPDSVCE